MTSTIPTASDAPATPTVSARFAEVLPWLDEYGHLAYSISPVVTDGRFYMYLHTHMLADAQQIRRTLPWTADVEDFRNYHGTAATHASCRGSAFGGSVTVISTESVPE